jgi:spore coat polysaccharide biosynthesis protein SpsF
VASTFGRDSDPIRDCVNNYFADNPRVYFYADHDAGEGDVLGRYFMCARKHNLQYIIRVTADCPLMQPEPIVEVLKELKKGHKVVSNSFPKRTLPKGLDVEGCTFAMLEKAHRKATDQQDREHVFTYMYKKFTFKNIVYDDDDSKMNLCVDWPWDIERLETAQAEPQ